MSFSGTDLATLLDEANHAPQHSLRAALLAVEGQPHPRIGWLSMDLAVRKRELWAAVCGVTGQPGPPDGAGLAALLEWEVQAARALEGWEAEPPQAEDVAARLRLSARLSCEHAGQILALSRGPRLA